MAELNIFIYKKGNSIIHKLHPTLKVILMVLSSYVITTGNNFILLYYISIIIFGFFISKLPLKLLLKDLKYLLFLGVIISLSESSIISGLIYTVRIGEMILLGTIFTGTTRPEDIAPGLFKIIRSRRIAQNIALTIGLIPTFLISWKEIESSLNSRGLYIRKNPLRILNGIVLPLLIETFKKADSISMAMESRCYTGWVEEEIRDTRINIPIIILIIFPYPLLIGKLLL